MTDSAHLTLGARRTALGSTAPGIDGVADSTGRRASADQLWHEHGWGLGSSAVAAVVALVLLASCIAQLLG